MREISREELHAPVYYGPFDHTQGLPIGVYAAVASEVLFLCLYETSRFFRDAIGCEYMSCAFILGGRRMRLGCRTLVPHRRANHERDYGVYRLVHMLASPLRGCRDLMRCVERFIH